MITLFNRYMNLKEKIEKQEQEAKEASIAESIEQEWLDDLNAVLTGEEIEQDALDTLLSAGDY